MHTLDIVIYALAAVLVLAAYLRDPGLPAVGLKAGFGFQRILTWEELPFMGGRFVLARVLPTLLLPIVAGCMVRLLHRD